MNRNDDYQDPGMRDVISGMFKGWVLALILIAMVGATAVALWAFGVFSSGVQGKGEAHKIKESAANRIVQNASFEKEWADIQMYDQQVKDATIRTFPGFG